MSSRNSSPPLTDIGRIVCNEINGLSGIYENVALDKFVVMPNHIHMIIILTGRSKTGGPYSIADYSEIQRVCYKKGGVPCLAKIFL